MTRVNSTGVKANLRPFTKINKKTAISLSFCCTVGEKKFAQRSGPAREANVYSEILFLNHNKPLTIP